MKIMHSAHHARDNIEYTDLASNEAHMKRRAAAVAVAEQ